MMSSFLYSLDETLTSRNDHHDEEDCGVNQINVRHHDDEVHGKLKITIFSITKFYGHHH